MVTTAQRIVVLSTPSEEEDNNLMQLFDECEAATNRWLALKEKYYPVATSEETPQTRAMWWIIKKAEYRMSEAAAEYNAAFEAFAHHWGHEAS